jgi:hypothetical protein
MYFVGIKQTDGVNTGRIPGTFEQRLAFVSQFAVNVEHGWAGGNGFFAFNYQIRYPPPIRCTFS